LLKKLSKMKQSKKLLQLLKKQRARLRKMLSKLKRKELLR